MVSKTLFAVLAVCLVQVSMAQFGGFGFKYPEVIQLQREIGQNAVVCKIRLEACGLIDHPDLKTLFALKDNAGAIKSTCIFTDKVCINQGCDAVSALMRQQMDKIEATLEANNCPL